LADLDDLLRAGVTASLWKAIGIALTSRFQSERLEIIEYEIAKHADLLIGFRIPDIPFEAFAINPIERCTALINAMQLPFGRRNPSFPTASHNNGSVW